MFSGDAERVFNPFGYEHVRQPDGDVDGGAGYLSDALAYICFGDAFAGFQQPHCDDIDHKREHEHDDENARERASFFEKEDEQEDVGGDQESGRGICREDGDQIGVHFRFDERSECGATYCVLDIKKGCK